MSINKEKCQVYYDMLLKIAHMTIRELNEDEYDYIMAMFHLNIGKLTMKKLEEKEKIRNDIRL